jgi:hypothetical protein
VYDTTVYGAWDGVNDTIQKNYTTTNSRRDKVRGTMI